MDLVATPGASNANSYVDLTFAASYFDTRLTSDGTSSDTWNDFDNKEVSLIQATRVLDSVYDWNGWQTTSSQALRWPREGAMNYDQAFGSNSMFDFDTSLVAYYPNNVVPTPLKNAVCEMAWALMENSGYTGDVNDLKLVRAGPIRVDFNLATPERSIPNSVYEMLRNLGNFAGTVGGNDVKTARLVRT